MELPKIDPKNPHAAEANQAQAKLSAAKVNPATIQAIIHMILAGLPGILDLIDKLIAHNPTPTPAPAPPVQ